MTLSRRQAIKVISGTGLALYFSPILFDPRRAVAATGESEAEFLRRFSPIDRTLEDKAFPDLSMHCNSFKWKRCSSQAGADQKQGINDSNPMSDVKQFLVNVGNRKGLVCRDASKIADSLML